MGRRRRHRRPPPGPARPRAPTAPRPPPAAPHTPAPAPAPPRPPRPRPPPPPPAPPPPRPVLPPLRSAEPEPATSAQRDELALSLDQSPGKIDQWIKDLAAGHRTFAGQLADRQNQTVPSEDPGYGDLGPAFPAWT